MSGASNTKELIATADQWMAELRRYVAAYDAGEMSQDDMAKLLLDMAERSRTALDRLAPILDALLGAPAGLDVLVEIAGERRRQIVEEGWTAEHDDEEHASGQLADAAACYLKFGRDGGKNEIPGGNYCPPGWPWEAEWWKPGDRRRDLIKAAALLVAELERLDRAAEHRSAA